MIGMIIGYIVIGLIVGALARLAIPGNQNMGLPLTIGLGVVGAVVGGLITRAVLGNGHGLITFIVSVVVAAILVSLLAGSMRGRSRV